MASNDTDIPPLYVLMQEIRKFTRASLILQHIIAEDMGLRVTDAECIDFLQEMGPSTAGDLARATRLTTGAITSMIDRLEKAGFVKRSKDPKDRRKVIVSFVPKKHGGAKKNYALLAQGVQELLSGYSEQQLRFLITHTQALTGIYAATARRLDSHEE
jgi:DNA-binding MarR family transcriptional regulator